MTDEKIECVGKLADKILVANRPPEHLSALWDLAEAVNFLLKEVKRHQMHATLPVGVYYSSAADMRRLASLYTHDLARPSSTAGEIALGSCVERLCLRLDEMIDDRNAWRSIVTDLNREASAAITNMGGVPR